MRRYVTEGEAEDILTRLGAVLVGDFHFVGKTGDHLGAYVSKEVPTSHPRELRVLADGIAWQLEDYGIEAIASPELGAIGLGIMVAEELGIDFAIVEKADADQMVVRRPAFRSVVANRRIAVVEDVVTKGTSTRQSTTAVVRAGGEVIAVAAIYSRSGQTEQSLMVPYLFPLVDRQLVDYPWDRCEYCERGVPIVTNVGHGQKFREEHPEVDVPYTEL